MARGLLMGPTIMKLLASLAALPLLAAAAPAFADGTDGAPAPAPAPAGQPDHTDWNDVSNINGQLVKVGEKNEYLYKFRRTNISTDPIAWVYGSYGLAISTALTDNVAVTGEVSMQSEDNDRHTGYEAGVSVPIYLKRTYQGVYLEPGLIVQHTEDAPDASCDATAPGGCTSAQRDFAGPEVMVGWHWTFDSGLNVSAAAGIARNIHSTSSNDPYASEADQLAPVGYLRFGYAF